MKSDDLASSSRTPDICGKGQTKGASRFAAPARARPPTASTFSVLPKRFLLPAVFLLALAMVLALCTEAVRATLREHPLFCLPALLGFLAAIVAARSVTRWQSGLSRLLERRLLMPGLFAGPLVVQVVLLGVVRPATPRSALRPGE